MSSEDRISNEELIKALKRSGYLLENRILQRFIDREFLAEANHNFSEESTPDKYREIDVLAHTLLCSMNQPDYHSLSLFVHFAIECQNNPQPVVLFKNKGDRDEPASDWHYTIINGEQRQQETIGLMLPNIIDNYERASGIPLASRQYCSFQKKKNKQDPEPWMAFHADDSHKTITKLVDYTKHREKELKARWDRVRPSQARLDFIIPVMVFQGELLLAEEKSDLEVADIPHHRLKAPYGLPYKPMNSIDVVTEQGFDDYLEKRISGLEDIFDTIQSELATS